jgi:hypothetical protein
MIIMKERYGFSFDQMGNSVQEKKAALDQKAKLDAYDRARQALAFMAKISSSGQIPDDHMATFYAATAIAESLLAIADAIYVSKGFSREPQEVEQRKEPNNG